MKVAVTTKGPELTSPVDSQFEQARYLILFDTESNEVRAYDLEECCIPAFDALITGKIGRKALHAFRAGDVVVYVGATGTGGEAIEAFNRDRLPYAIEAYEMFTRV